MSDHEREISRIIRKATKETEAERTSELSVSGNHNVNVIAMNGARIVVGEKSHRSEAQQNKPTVKKNTWRQELEGLIWQRVWDLGMTTDQFYDLAAKKLRRTEISSLAKIAERDLGILYEMLATMRRPALD